MAYTKLVTAAGIRVGKRVIDRPSKKGRISAALLVELPGIEPGSYGIPSRLLRAQFAMPLLGSPVHAN